MTPEDLHRVLATAERVHDDAGLSAAFYQRLFERAPELRELFPADMDHQLQRFVDELEGLARALPDLGGFETRAHLLGARHAGYGVTSRHYPLVRDALLDAMTAHLGETFDAAHRDSWLRAFNLLTEIMLEGADQTGGSPAAVE